MRIDSKSLESQIQKSDIHSNLAETHSMKAGVHQWNRNKRENYEKIVGKDENLSSEQQNKSNGLNTDCMTISMDSLPGESMQIPKDTENNEKELQFEDKTGTPLALTQTTKTCKL